MAKRNIPPDTTPPKPAAETTAAKDALPPVEAPKITPELAAEAKAAPAAPVIESITPVIKPTAPADPVASEQQAARWKLPAYAPLAAGLAVAVIAGALAGAATTAGLMRDPSPAAGATQALQDSVAQLGNELASLKAGIAASQRATGTQFGKLAERLDRSEKAQAEPAAKLAKLQESIDKLDHRQQQQAAAAAAAAEVTGSVVAKQDAKPPVVEGWRLRDFYAGRAVVESRNGTLFEIGPGSNVPGLGKVETIKRDNGRVVVTTSSGTITAALEPHRPSYAPPYRY